MSRLVPTAWVMMLVGVFVFSDGVSWAQQAGTSAVSAPRGSSESRAKAATRNVAGISGKGSDANYRIGPGDVLSIAVWGQKSLDRMLMVKPDGSISVPLLNETRAGGLTPEELQKELVTAFGEFVRITEVSVIVKQVGLLRASVLGKVGAPGGFSLQRGTTVLEVIAVAGGLNEFASSSSIAVLRRKGRQRKAIPFDYGAAIQGNRNANFVLRTGDVVVVN